MTSFEKLAQSRESCRNFANKAVESEKITAILEAARMAPSACNSQPWHFTVATGENAKKIAACTHELGKNKFTDDCPAFIIINESVEVRGQGFQNLEEEFDNAVKSKE